MGRNKMIYDVFNAFTTEKNVIVYLCGQSGSGKTMLSKHIANYMMERHKIADVEYKNHDKIASVSHILAHLPDSKARGPNMSNKDVLFILDNMDTVLMNKYNELHDGLKEVLQRMNFKFLILCSSPKLIKSPDVLQTQKEKVIEIKPLNALWAATLLKQMVESYLPWTLRNIAELQNHPICNMRCTPKMISEIAHSVRSGYTLDKIAADLSLKGDAAAPNPVEELNVTDLIKYLQ